MGEAGGRKNKERKKQTNKPRSNYKSSQNIRTIHVFFLESVLSVFFPSLGVTVYLASLGCPLSLGWSLDLLWGQLGL